MVLFSVDEVLTAAGDTRAEVHHLQLVDAHGTHPLIPTYVGEASVIVEVAEALAGTLGLPLVTSAGEIAALNAERADRST